MEPIIQKDIGLIKQAGTVGQIQVAEAAAAALPAE
jgi:hypothetical protein